jgi:hypothetical protein
MDNITWLKDFFNKRADNAKERIDNAKTYFENNTERALSDLAQYGAWLSVCQDVLIGLEQGETPEAMSQYAQRQMNIVGTASPSTNQYHNAYNGELVRVWAHAKRKLDRNHP